MVFLAIFRHSFDKEPKLYKNELRRYFTGVSWFPGNVHIVYYSVSFPTIERVTDDVAGSYQSASTHGQTNSSEELKEYNQIHHILVAW